MRVLIRYLCSNEEVEVEPGKRLENNRVQNSVRLLEGVSRVDYTPDFGHACAKCSWNLICAV